MYVCTGKYDQILSSPFYYYYCYIIIYDDDFCLSDALQIVSSLNFLIGHFDFSSTTSPNWPDNPCH